MSSIPGDFPEVSRMKKLLAESDFSEFPRLNETMMDIVDDMMTYDIPQLMKKIPQERNQFTTDSKPLTEAE